MPEVHTLSEYEIRRLERIAKNERYLESLGLGSAKQKLKEMTQKTKRNAARRLAMPKIKPGEERRSQRISKGKTSLVMLSYDADDDTERVTTQDDDDDYASEDNEDVTVNSRYFRSRKINIDRADWEMTTDEKKALERNIDDSYLAKFKEFLIFHNKISDQNVRSVMRQVGKLARGEGIRYESRQYAWPEGCYFMRGTKVTLTSDIVQLMEEAQECENKWGRDHGNGWLLSHPLKKLLLFQQFALNNLDFLNAKCKLKDYYALDDDLDLDMGTEFTATDEPPREPSGAPKTPEQKAKSGKVRTPALVSPSPTVHEAKRENVKHNKITKEPCKHLRARIAKNFDRLTYFGTVTDYCSESELWHIDYDDGDEETVDAKELRKMLIHYEKRKGLDKPRKFCTKRAAVTVTPPPAPAKKPKRSTGRCVMQ